MKPNLTKYKIGFGVIALIVLGLGIFVILQASNTKHDKQITKSAQDIARKLNDYLDNEQKIPESLSAAGIKNVPPDVSYQKLSDKSFKFCVTYKTKNTVLLSPLLFLSPFGGSPLSSGAYDSVDWPTGDESSYLYVDDSHPKGQHCQTITKDYWDDSGTTLYDDQSSSTSGSSNSSPYTICGRGYNYVTPIAHVSAVTPKSSTAGASITTDTQSPATTVKLDPAAQFFDSNCKALTFNDIHVGDLVNIYYDPYGSPATTIVKAY